MNKAAAQTVANKTIKWYHKNNKSINNFKFPFIAKSANKPKFSEEIWAMLLTEAIQSFHEGLEGVDPEPRRASVKDQRKLYQSAVDFVGEEAFKHFAYLVAASPRIAQNLSTEIENAWEVSSKSIQNEMDQQVYGMVSSTIMNSSMQDLNQAQYHEMGSAMQYYSKYPGLSPEFASSVASIGAQYLQVANDMTRESVGPAPSSGDLPTGVSIQGPESEGE